MSLFRRIRKLEAEASDSGVLVPRNREWFSYWCDRLDGVAAACQTLDLPDIPIEVVDSLVQAANHEDQAPTSAR